MKNLIYFLLLIVFALTSCEQSVINDTTSNQEDDLIGTTLKGKLDKVTICHYDAEMDIWKTISINGNALKAHLNHGDVQLIDTDGDGWVSFENGCVDGGDCDDTNLDVNPGMDEIPYNGKDDDCDPATLDDDLDEDGFPNADDCDDTDAAINTGAEEVCANGIDDNCNGEVDEGCEVTEGVFIDNRDGKEYKWVKIGNQIWMAENLAYEWYSVNFALYQGGIVDYAHLYIWDYALNNCCPDGWHLPSDAEWTELSNFLIDNGYGYDGSGDDIAQSMTDNSLWGAGLWPGSPNYGGSGADPSLNNTSGFSALPAGFGYKPGGDFYEYPTPDNLDQIFSFPPGNSNPGESTEWWSSTKQHGTDEVYTRGILRFDPILNRTTYNSKEFAFSVRCVKD